MIASNNIVNIHTSSKTKIATVRNVTWNIWLTSKMCITLYKDNQSKYKMSFYDDMLKEDGPNLSDTM